jgi:hypothetical protein
MFDFKSETYQKYLTFWIKVDALRILMLSIHITWIIRYGFFKIKICMVCKVLYRHLRLESSLTMYIHSWCHLLGNVEHNVNFCIKKSAIRKYTSWYTSTYVHSKQSGTIFGLPWKLSASWATNSVVYDRVFQTVGPEPLVGRKINKMGREKRKKYKKNWVRQTLQILRMERVVLT